MKQLLVATLLAGTALAGSFGLAHATPLTVSASLFSPQIVAGTATAIALGGISVPSHAPIVTPDYTITFGSTPADQGVVQDTVSGRHATPVAGEIGGAAEYLTGDYGSSLTTDVHASGAYVSTDLGTITISFTHEQTAFALLWGSIDPNNLLTFGFNDGSTDTVIGSVAGSDAQAAAAGFVSNGFQGPGGSAYVAINSDTPFNEVVFSSGMVSFEAAGLVASTARTDVPEPASLALVTVGLAGLGMIRRRRTNG